MRQILLSIIFASLAASLFPVVANDYFDSVRTPGFFCFDICLLCCLFAICSVRSIVCQVVFLLVSLFIFIAGWSLFFEAAFSMSLWEVWGVAKFFWWGIVLFAAVPIIQLSVHFFLIRKIFSFKKRMSLIGLIVLLVSVFMVHQVSALIQSRQPILDFPIYEYFKQQVQPGRITNNTFLQRDVKDKYGIVDSTSFLIQNFRPTVMILLESWGLRRDYRLNEDEFNVFLNNDVKVRGLWRRYASFTQSAEYEDFGMNRGMKNGKTTIELYSEEGYETWYIHGFDGSFYDREKIYDTLGFASVKFKADLLNDSLEECHFGNIGFEGICDSSVIGFVEKLLGDAKKKFIYWTTLDSHPPYDSQKRPMDEICIGLSDVECIHAVHIRRTLKLIAGLAQRHPDYQFVIRGDHRPMGALTSKKFITSFYYCWVPILVLN